MSMLHEVETSPIPEFDLAQLSARHRALFGERQTPAKSAYMMTPDVEGTVSFLPQFAMVPVTCLQQSHSYLGNDLRPRSNYQVAIDPSVFGQAQSCSIVCGPSRTFVDLFNIRREAVTEALTSLRSEARNEQTWVSLTEQGFWELYHKFGNRNWAAIFNKIDSFSNLKVGWDGYSARPPQQAAIRSAKLFLSQLTRSDREPDRVKPSVIGGIGMTFKSNDRKCYVEFYNNGTVYALFSDGQGDPETRQIRPTAQDYKLLIKAIQEYLNAGHP